MNLEKLFTESVASHRTSVEYLCEELFLEVTEQIALEMKLHAVSRVELAKRMTTQPSRITALLSGRENMTLRTLVKMCQALGLKASVYLDPFGAEGMEENVKEVVDDQGTGVVARGDQQEDAVRERGVGGGDLERPA